MPGPHGDPERILIVRLTAIGDVIHGLPALCALRDAFPKAWISWVVEGGGEQILRGHPALDEVIHAPRRWYHSRRQTLQLRRRLRAARFDVAVDLQCLTKSALVAWLSGAPRRLGVAGRHGRELSRWLNNELTEVQAPHVIEQYLGVLAPLGIRQPAVRFELAESEADKRFADDALWTTGLPRGGFLLINPGAGWDSKLWPAERYGEVAARMLRKHGVRTLVAWSGEAELGLAKTIEQSSAAAAVVAPATSLMQLAALARRAALFLGSDTGPMHLAVAVGSPTISLHGPSRSEWCGAYGPENIRLQAAYDDSPARKRPGASNAAMRAITVDDVCEACDQLITASATNQRRAG